MTDIEQLRIDVIAHLERAQSGRALDRASARGLLMMFNKLAPNCAIQAHEYSGEIAHQHATQLPPDELDTGSDRPAGEAP